MEDLNRRRQRLVALVKATRAAIILPALFGLLILFVQVEAHVQSVYP